MDDFSSGIADAISSASDISFHVKRFVASLDEYRDTILHGRYTIQQEDDMRLQLHVKLDVALDSITAYQLKMSKVQQEILKQLRGQ